MNLLNLFKRRPEPESAVPPAMLAEVGRLARDLTGIVAQFQQQQLNDGGNSERRTYNTGRPGQVDRRAGGVHGTGR